MLMTKKKKQFKPGLPRTNNLSILPDSSRQKKTWFVNNSKKIKQHILKGDIYQANLTRAVWGCLAEDEIKLAKRLFHLNPAPMQGYMKTEHLSLISTSPERFFRKNSSRLEAFPIKGTVKRENTLSIKTAKASLSPEVYLKKKDRDKKLKKKLYNNSKDRAELAMITDLMQNDFSPYFSYGEREC